MGQALKYGALAVAIGALLTLALAIFNEMYPTQIVSNLGSSVNSFVSSCSSYLGNARRALNYVLGSPLPLDILLYFWLLLPFARISFKVITTVINFINK